MRNNNNNGGVEEEEEVKELVQYPPLFETKRAKGRGTFKLFSGTVLVGICLIWFYRWRNIPPPASASSTSVQLLLIRRWTWIAMMIAEFWFGFYWIITLSVRWNIVYRYPFKHRLAHRDEEKELPGVDIFICTADPILEPPILVINTVLSLMSYNYPTEKLSIYLSDDGGSHLTFYALLEASRFSKHWIPFCKKFKVEPRSPAAYFARNSDPENITFKQEWFAIKKLYEEMKMRIEVATNDGIISKELKDKHKGFSEWNIEVTKQDHQAIVQIVIDGRNLDEVDIEGHQLPTLVYLAREKRPQWPHNFKAGSMNALIRVSSKISDGPIILNLDCDMYANDPDAIQEALCFFMDEENGHEISYVQHPQSHENYTKNDIYSNAASVCNKMEFAGLDGYGAAMYCGTGCFHRRKSLCGVKYSKNDKVQWDSMSNQTDNRTIEELEDASKVLAACRFEVDTQWGKEMGLVYGCPVEDVVTGLTIQCRGWKPIFYNPDKKAFLGVAPITLEVALVQFKRWSEGMFRIFFSKHCPFLYGHGKIKLGAQMGYCVYLLWAPNCFPTLCYVLLPALCNLCGVSLFPKEWSLWFFPFAYVFGMSCVYSLAESVYCGDTLKAWWNTQRMWVFRRTTSFMFGFIDTVFWQLGLSQTSFAITAKVIDNDVSKRHEQEILEFGSSSIMFTIISTLGLVNLGSFVWTIFKTFVVLDTQKMRKNVVDHEVAYAQVMICGIIVLMNLPVYEALFFRNDEGRIPSSVMVKSVILASLVCSLTVFV